MVVPRGVNRNSPVWGRDWVRVNMYIWKNIILFELFLHHVVERGGGGEWPHLVLNSYMVVLAISLPLISNTRGVRTPLLPPAISLSSTGCKIKNYSHPQNMKTKLTSMYSSKCQKIKIMWYALIPLTNWCPLSRHCPSQHLQHVLQVFFSSLSNRKRRQRIFIRIGKGQCVQWKYKTSH